jgi:hypothetical protein
MYMALMERNKRCIRYGVYIEKPRTRNEHFGALRVNIKLTDVSALIQGGCEDMNCGSVSTANTLPRRTAVG